MGLELSIKTIRIREPLRTADQSQGCFRVPISPRAAQESRRKALVVEHRLVTLLVLLGMSAGLLTIATSLAARFSAIGGNLLP